MGGWVVGFKQVVVISLRLQRASLSVLHEVESVLGLGDFNSLGFFLNGLASITRLIGTFELWWYLSYEVRFSTTEVVIGFIVSDESVALIPVSLTFSPHSG